jgi:hypothetical protein
MLTFLFYTSYVRAERFFSLIISCKKMIMNRGLMNLLACVVFVVVLKLAYTIFKIIVACYTTLLLKCNHS